MTDGHRLSSLRLVLRSLGHRRGQTLLVVLVAALISGSVIAAAGYQSQVQQTIVDAAFATDGPGNTWMLTGVPGTDLAALVPPSSGRLTGAPVAGRTARVEWSSAGASAISGTLAWRADVCSQLVMVSGRCPSTRGEVAVSAADEAAYRVSTGDRLEEHTTIGEPVQVRVSGVYRPRDPADPYWFGNPPIGRSGFDAMDLPQSDQLITVAGQFEAPTYSETLDLRIDHEALRTRDMPALTADTAGLADAAAHHEARLVTGVPASLTRIAEERARVVGGLALTLGQLGVLVLVVMALLASVTLADQRAELGLARLRGEEATVLRRLVVGRWSSMIVVGWLLGWAPGLGALALAAHRLPGQHGLALRIPLLVAAVSVLVIMVAVVVPGARTMLAQPVTSLLRAAPSSVREDRGRLLVVDLALVVLAASGLLVAVQAGTASVLGLLVPSLLAIAGAVLLVRAVVHLATVRRRRLVRGRIRPGPLLGTIMVARLRGLRILVVATCLAAAFAIFAVQVQVIGSAARRHDAEVVTGAAAVVQIDGTAADAEAVLADIDPQHATSNASMTAVVVTRRADPGALRGMFVEPAGFARVALGADRTTDAAGWASITAPAVEPVSFTADALVVRTAAHSSIGQSTSEGPARTGTRAALGVDYLTADGVAHSVVVGQLSLAAGPGERFRRAIGCAAGCRLLRITLAPNGPVGGEIRLSSLTAELGSVQQPVDLGPADHWTSVPVADPKAHLQPEAADAGGLLLRAESGGLALAVQQHWLPVSVPVLLAADVRPEAEPTVAAPDGVALPVRPVGRVADGVPGQLEGVAIADLDTALRAGHRDSVLETAVQIWVGADGLDRIGDLDRALGDRGLRVVQTSYLRDAIAAQRTTASALTGQVVPGLAVLAGLFAALGIGLTVVGHRRVLRRDLGALRLAGVRRASLRRAVTVAYLGPGVLAVLLGAVAGSVGCVLVIGGLPLLPMPHPAIHTDLGLRPAALVGCVVVFLGVVVGATLLSIRGLMRDSGPDGLRGPR